MNLMKCLGLMAGVAVLAATGCAGSGTVVRGQSPVVVGESDGPLIGTAPGYGDKPKLKHAKKHDFRVLDYHRDHVLGHDNGQYSGVEAYYPDHQMRVYETDGYGAGCPACDGGMSCPPGGCPHCGCGHGHCKGNKHTYQYKWPENLVYPPPVLPAGMVVYPYYTLRGPTDFFMK